MGSLFSKKSTIIWLRCRECNSKDVRLFERMCRVCVASAKRLEPPASDCEKPLFGEYLCTSCTLGWTSRLCWPCHYQTCRSCQHIVYPHYWHDLTLEDLLAIAKDHQREYCQKCLEKMVQSVLSCSCGDKSEGDIVNKLDSEGISTFPSSDQIWGMVGTILAIGAVWILFSKIKQNRKSGPVPLMPGQETSKNRKNEQPPVTTNKTKTPCGTNRRSK